MAVKINSGDLNRKVVFKQPTSSLNDQKEKTLTHSDAFTVFAAVRKFNKNRTTEAHADSLIGALDFYVRSAANRESVNEDWLIGMDGKDYVIHEIELVDMEDTKETFLRFTAKSKQ